jgi:hypothetical protein
MPIIENTQKNFENPNSGVFLATVADVVDLGPQTTQYGTKVKVRIVWILNANDSEGKPFRVMRQCTASVNEKSALYELAKGVLGTAPPVPFDTEVLIGRSNQLVIVKETDAKTGKEFANVKAVLPLPAGSVAPRVPADFVRSKDRPARTFPQSGAPTVQQTQAPAANTVATTPTTGGVSTPAVAVDADF